MDVYCALPLLSLRGSDGIILPRRRQRLEAAIEGLVGNARHEEWDL